ncbi:transketolase [Pseudoalteromonas xiamenensis]|uniref:Transketolase n=1 Tax=Pseudoalteromonas xiamenensis TaxID=882626 RepID=A0A975DH65_9GAMM|nr:transketolase [Pseudoalteromonas xiamenensis]QTH71047.1 transketolase [Pseudoalteromonas xiamenensis]
MQSQLSANIRYTLCEVSSKTKTPHLGSCLSGVDILVALYWHVLNINPDQPTKDDRDFFLLSKGHAANLLYTTLAYRGFFPIDSLYQHGATGSQFEEHPGINAPLGVENVSGSLGHALSLATGMALTCKIQNRPNQFYVLMGDGELNEGTVWEAAMFAAGQKLDNLVAIVDFNKLQGTGESCDIMHLEKLEDKWSAFGWHSIRVDGHCQTSLLAAFEQAKHSNRPVCIVADTIKGKGISFMENDNNWHYRIPTSDELITIKEELGLS